MRVQTDNSLPHKQLELQIKMQEYQQLMAEAQAAYAEYQILSAGHCGSQNRRSRTYSPASAYQRFRSCYNKAMNIINVQIPRLQMNISKQALREMTRVSGLPQQYTNYMRKCSGLSTPRRRYRWI